MVNASNNIECGYAPVKCTQNSFLMYTFRKDTVDEIYQTIKSSQNQ